MAIGGFNGSDPSSTLAQFQAYVREHKIHYFIAGGLGASNTRFTTLAAMAPPPRAR